MCGIVGYTGARQAAPLLLEGLKRLEYRGYDSAGLALVDEGRIEVHKAAGKIAVLEKTLGTSLPPGHTGIAHTRWATHGIPNTINAHPHTDCGGTLALVHNGIIENADHLRTAIANGPSFARRRPSAVPPHRELHKTDGSLVEAGRPPAPVEGTYGIAVIATLGPNVVAARAARRSRGDRNREISSRGASAVLPHRARSSTSTTVTSGVRPDEYPHHE